MPSRPPVHRPAGWRPPEQREQACKADADRQRGSARARGYDRAWERLSRAVRQAEPLYRLCAHPRGRLSH
ncbi:hypothetical protein F1188_18305 [Roseospira marina]|uniref:Uncharacterized protein n=1 Tax=Roseospira marina TaxID=140057 RepID=A0A5M6I776_9PROT|nr:hypothetical protein [Roseospira marina]KAA5603973.1 hypothetical protein F1188_18305 [Roseospira marina]MBB4315946.1 hypothetical protein [Roseospira marina]MBB5089093.1 hypothetical protein [Roseospira marina]